MMASVRRKPASVVLKKYDRVGHLLMESFEGAMEVADSDSVKPRRVATALP